MITKPKLEPWMSAFEKLTGAKFVTVKAIGQDGRGETNTIENIITELKQRRDWNNPEEVEIWFEEKLRAVKAQAVAEERKRVKGVIENTFTVYFRSIYSQDCSRNETKEDKSTEMIKLSDVIDLLSPPIQTINRQ